MRILYNDRLTLTAQEIYEKQFKFDARGYRPQEVDKFLDMVIRDYTEYDNIIKKLEKEIKEITDDNIKLKQEIRKLQNQLSVQEQTPSRSVNNVDILKRISNLEKIVYGNNE